MSTPTSDDLSGRLLGRYRVRRLLGRGGMGSVYEAVQEDLGRVVALKVLDPVLATHDDQLERFRREATSAAALGHSNIVSVTDFGARSSSGDPPYLVMELLSGESLGKLLDRESVLAPERVAFIASQVLAALGAAHGAGIVHRDVKPDNVFLTSTSAFRDLVKVLDFGIAKLSAEHGNARLTGTGAMLGTPAYMAPEQARGATVDHRADIYAVGATMYQALAGRLPHDAPSFPAMLFAIVEQSPEPLSRLRPDVPPGLVAVVERAMAKDPDARYPSAEAMRAALAPYLPGTATATLSGPVSSDAATVSAPAGLGPASGGHYGPPTPVVVRSEPPAATAPPPAPKTPSVAGLSHTNPAAAQPPPHRSIAGVVAMSAVAGALILGGVAIAIVKITTDSRTGAAAAASTTSTSSTSTPTVEPTVASASPSASTVVSAPSGAITTQGVTTGHPKVVPTTSASAEVPKPGASAALLGTAAIAPPPGGGKLYGGDRGFKSGSDFSACKDCDWHSWGAAMTAEEPAISACFKASLHEPPMHEFPFYFVYLDGDGTVKDIEIRGEATPNLDRCLGTILRRHPLSKTTTTPGVYHVGFSGECKTFQCK